MGGDAFEGGFVARIGRGFFEVEDDVVVVECLGGEEVDVVLLHMSLGRDGPPSVDVLDAGCLRLFLLDAVLVYQGVHFVAGEVLHVEARCQQGNLDAVAQ